MPTGQRDESLSKGVNPTAIIEHMRDWEKMPSRREALTYALLALREKAERENPKPMTLDGWERIQEIVKSLREHAQYKPSDVWGSQRRDCNDAADALEAATAPMTCAGCKWELDVWTDKCCWDCIRYGSYEDRYEPKGAER